MKTYKAVTLGVATIAMLGTVIGLSRSSSPRIVADGGSRVNAGTMINSSMGDTVLPPPPRKTPLESDFKLTAESAVDADLGGEFVLRLADAGSPMSPTGCRVSLPGYAAHYVQVEEQSCSSIRLRAPLSPVPRSEDGRASAKDDSAFQPVVTISFSPPQQDIAVSKIEGVEALNIRNATGLQLAPGSSTALGRGHPARLHMAFPKGPVPASFRCEWSDNLGTEIDTRRVYLDPTHCDTRIDIVAGNNTRLYYLGLVEMKRGDFGGQLATAMLSATKFSEQVTVVADGEAYSTATIELQLDGTSKS